MNIVFYGFGGMIVIMLFALSHYSRQIKKLQCIVGLLREVVIKKGLLSRTKNLERARDNTNQRVTDLEKKVGRASKPQTPCANMIDEVKGSGLAEDVRVLDERVTGLTGLRLSVIEAFDSRLDALEKSNADLIAEATMPCPHCGVRFEGEKGTEAGRSIDVEKLESHIKELRSLILTKGVMPRLKNCERDIKALRGILRRHGLSFESDTNSNECAIMGAGGDAADHIRQVPKKVVGVRRNIAKYGKIIGEDATPTSRIIHVELPTHPLDDGNGPYATIREEENEPKYPACTVKGCTVKGCTATVDHVHYLRYSPGAWMTAKNYQKDALIVSPVQVEEGDVDWGPSEYAIPLILSPATPSGGCKATEFPLRISDVPGTPADPTTPFKKGVE